MKPNTGTQFYQIPQNDGFITASVRKNDGSGDNLTVSIYVDGTLVKTTSTTTPYGVLDVTAVLPPTGASPVVNNSGSINLPAAPGHDPSGGLVSLPEQGWEWPILLMGGGAHFPESPARDPNIFKNYQQQSETFSGILHCPAGLFPVLAQGSSGLRRCF